MTQQTITQYVFENFEFYGETNGDGKFRVYDSNHRYLDYVEYDDDNIDEIVKELDSFGNVSDLLTYIGLSPVKISYDIRDITNSMVADDGYEIIDGDYIGTFESYYVHRLAEYYILLPLDVDD